MLRYQHVLLIQPISIIRIFYIVKTIILILSCNSLFQYQYILVFSRTFTTSNALVITYSFLPKMFCFDLKSHFETVVILHVWIYHSPHGDDNESVYLGPYFYYDVYLVHRATLCLYLGLYFYYDAYRIYYVIYDHDDVANHHDTRTSQTCAF